MIPENKIMDDQFHVDQIKANHFSLYKKIAKICGLKSFHGDKYSYIMTEEAEWPNMIYDLQVTNESTDDILKNLGYKIDEHLLPSNLIIDNFSKTINFDKIARQYNFMPMMRWPGMINILSEFKPYENQDESVKVKKVESTSDLSEWILITRRTLFTRQGIKTEVFKPVLDEPSIELYLAYYNGNPASTLLINYHKESAGLYVGATLPEYRNKGIMSRLFNHVNLKARKRNMKYSILEANANSHKLYSTLGFKTICNFDIFLKMHSLQK